MINIQEIKNFHPKGKEEPTSGSIYQKGGYWKQVNENANSFINENKEYYLIYNNFELTETVHGKQYGLFDYKGGMVILSTDVSSLEVSDSKIKNWFVKTTLTTKNNFFIKKGLFNLFKKFLSKGVKKYIGTLSIGNFFNGGYIGGNGKTFNEKSISIELGGVSSEGLTYFAKEIAREFDQEVVLIKDFNKNKVFLVNI